MKNLKITIMSFAFLCLMGGEICAYVMPLEQILARVRKTSANINTLIIEQATHVIQSRDPLRERVFREKVWLKTPRHERTMEVPAPRESTGVSSPDTVPPNAAEGRDGNNLPDPAQRQSNPDAAYRWLLMANPKGEIAAFLTQLGIQIGDLGYDRCDGVVAYRVGARSPDGPRLLVDKERFFPLLLSYILPGDPEGRLVTVRFRDYRKDDAGWYPYEIEYALQNSPTEVYHVLNLTANAPLQATFFERKTPPAATPPNPSLDQRNPDDQRLKKILQNLEKKHP